MGKSFNVSVCGFRFLRINHMNIMIILILRGMSRKSVSIKNSDQIYLPDGLVIAQNVKEPSSCPI